MPNFMVNPWSGQQVMVGQPMGQPAMRRSMHELGTIAAPTMPMAAFFPPPPPPPLPQQRTSSPSVTSQTSEWSRMSEVAKKQRQQTTAKGGRKKRPKREKRFHKSSSRPQSRSHSRNSHKDWNEGDYPRSEERDSGEEAAAESFGAVEKAEPVWTCDYCTYANGANVAVCQMCAKTARVARKSKSRQGSKRPSSAATNAKSRAERALLKSPSGSEGEENDDTEQDVRRAYYAVRRSAGGKMMERGERNFTVITNALP